MILRNRMTRALSLRFYLPILALLMAPGIMRAQIQVDCSGANPSAYPSINAALPNAGPGSTILVTGTCNEHVVLENVNNLSLGAWFGQTATVNGGIEILDSKLVYLYGLNFINSANDGIVAAHSTSVVIDSCTSNYNGLVGLAVRYMSEVAVITTGAFDNNAAHGMFIDTNSNLLLVPFGGPLDISNNGADGVNASVGATFSTWGNTSISNNGIGGGGWGIELLGGARAQVAGIFGPNTIQGNPLGGLSAQEGSEVSVYNINGIVSSIQGNGPVGVSVGAGSQVTLFDGVQVSGHSGAGVEVFANSQAKIFGTNSIFGNGTFSDPRSAGIRADGNSEVFARGGDISQNKGPGMLALVNSSLDFTGVSFSSNGRGLVTCDSSAYMVSDLAQANGFVPPGVACRVPHSLGNRLFSWKAPRVPDCSSYKAMQARYKKIATKRGR